MITDILDELRKREHFSKDFYIEFAKGSHERVTTWSGFKRKVKRICRRK